MYDIIIIGAGPAGMTAAIYARRAAKTVLVLEALSYGGQIINTPDIENYPAAAHVSGFDFATGVYNQASSALRTRTGSSAGVSRTARPATARFTAKRQSR